MGLVVRSSRTHLFYIVHRMPVSCNRGQVSSSIYCFGGVLPQRGTLQLLVAKLCSGLNICLGSKCDRVLSLRPDLSQI